MSTAKELLAAAQEDGTMTIDGELRTISIPSGYEILGVESDDDVNRIDFRGPRYYHGLDLSKFDIRVNIENAKGDLDMFPITDVTVEDDVINFSWLVGRYTAQYQGVVTFSLCFREIDSQGVITREFNTTTATGRILEGLETGGVIIQQNPDVLESILQRLKSLEENGGSSGSATCSNPKIHVKEYVDISDIASLDFSNFNVGDIVLAYQVEDTANA